MDTPIEYINPGVPEVEVPEYSGARYGAKVPDTLDIQERCALALHALTSQTDERSDYEIYWATKVDKRPAYMYHDWNDSCWGKWAEALPLLRLASGSRENREVEQAWLNVILKMQGPDGLLYFPTTGKPWWSTGCPTLPPGDHYAVMHTNGRLLGAVTVYYLVTGSPEWKEVGKRLVDGLRSVAAVDGDKAHFAWVQYAPPGQSPSAATPDARFTAAEPASLLHNMSTWIAWTIQGLANYNRATDYEPALVLAGQLSRWVIADSGAFDSEGKFMKEPGSEMAHFHGHLMSLLSILDYALAAHDEEALAFVRKGFDYARAHGNTLVGFFPEWIEGGTQETCELADMISIALKLSRSGEADYWEEADRWIRNSLAEQQLLNKEWVVDAASEAPPCEPDDSLTTERLPERILGSFSYTATGNEWWTVSFWTIACCNGNASRTLYHTWENTLSFEKGALSVNLLLNRASPWADVNSYLPYEGRVDIRMKTPGVLRVRIPEWITLDEVKAQVDNASHPIKWDGQYAVLGGLEGGQVSAVTFPMVERTEKTTICGADYELVMRGNTVVSIDPPGERFPLYRREHMRTGTVPWRQVERFVPETPVDW